MNKRAAIYCRLSKDDEQAGDSVSIETQRMMLTSYCANQNFEVVDIYVDDGYSGLNFDRPSFKRLISDLENGKFDIIVTKDLSRLGRDYIQTGYYMDVYFSRKHIRYIAVNDGIDTLLENNDIAPFKNILNDMYAKDLSRKVKSAKQQRAQQGLHISSQAPYGYKVDPLNRNRLMVDSETADVVKLIFELAQEGNSYSSISRILEKKRIVSPSAYKAMNGDTRFIKYSSKDHLYKWPYQTVKAIICNPVYVGDMVNHKVETINYKTKERVRIPLEEQIIVPNTHTPIIDRSIFAAVNQKFSNRRRKNHMYNNVFKGLIFCDECGTEMQLIAKKLKEETKPMFRCTKHIEDSTVCTHNHFIYYEDLLFEVGKQFTTCIMNIIDSESFDELCMGVLQLIASNARKIKANNLHKKLQELNQSIKERYKAVSADTVASELAELHSVQKNLIQKITENAVDRNEISSIDIGEFRNVIKNFLRQMVIGQNIINLFIDRIEIGHLEREVFESPSQKIKIYYRF